MMSCCPQITIRHSVATMPVKNNVMKWNHFETFDKAQLTSPGVGSGTRKVDLYRVCVRERKRCLTLD